MKWPLISTDLVTLVGMMATLVGIFLCLFFLFAPVTFGTTPTVARIEPSRALELSMRWVQPVLGQAIVEDALVQRQHRSAVEDAKQTQPDGGAPGQWMMGRLIIELTQAPSADRQGPKGRRNAEGWNQDGREALGLARPL